jgi:predicted acyltransferase
MTEPIYSKPQAERYLSLDVLRGLTIALMITVNCPGDWSAIYAPFRHAEWHGFTITDLVFPTFLFVVGNALSFSIGKLKAAGDKVFLQKVFKRALIIFAIGLFVNYFPFIAFKDGEYVFKNIFYLRIWGVLQRIAVCYLLASLLVYYFNTLSTIIISVVILLGYWAVLYYFGTSGDPYSLAGNAVIPVDLFMLPAKNLYQGYGIPFDPEGFLSTFPAVVNVVFGFLAGNYIRKWGNKTGTVGRLALAGIVFLLVAQLWDAYFPINKPIWTSSYVLYTVGWDLLLIAALMLVIEIFRIKKWAYFFEVFGKNPLFIYVLSGVLIKILSLIRIQDMSFRTMIYENVFLSWLPDKTASLCFALAYVSVLWLIGYIMDKRKIYVKV